MQLDTLSLKVRGCEDIEELRRMALNLIKCLSPDKQGEGYCVVNDHSPEFALYNGSRSNCIAFIEGYETAPLTDVGCFDPSCNCVCVDTPSRTIVIPTERFGETLGRVKQEPNG